MPTDAFAALRALVLASALFAGGCSSENDYTVMILFEPEELREAYETVDLYLVERCEGITAGETPNSSFEHRTIDASATGFRWLEDTEPGLYGMYAVASSSCNAAGCQEHVITEGGKGLHHHPSGHRLQ